MKPKIYYWMFVICLVLVVAGVVCAVFEGGAYSLYAMLIALAAAIAAIILESKCKDKINENI